MPKFTLTCDYSDENSTHVVTHEFTADVLYLVLEQFEMFLKGAGYVFDGNLDFVDHEQQFNELTEKIYGIERMYGHTQAARTMVKHLIYAVVGSTVGGSVGLASYYKLKGILGL